MTDKVVTKKGDVFTGAEYNGIQRKDREERMRLRNALRNDYHKYRNQGMTDEETRTEIMEVREVSKTVLNNALNTGNMNAKATVEWSAKMLTLQAKEETFLDDELEMLDHIIEDVLSQPPTAMFTVEVSNLGVRGSTMKQIPRDEYLLLKMREKRKAAKETLDSLKVLRGSDMNVNIIVTDAERDERMRTGLGKFNVEIDADFEVKDADNDR